MELFKFLVMGKIWYKILQAINDRNIKIELANLSSLVDELHSMKDSWKTLFNECKFMGTSFEISTEFSDTKRSKMKNKLGDELEMTPSEELRFSMLPWIVLLAISQEDLMRLKKLIPYSMYYGNFLTTMTKED